MDIVGSIAGLSLLIALFPILAAIIWLDSRGSPLYSQERMGYRGRPFMIWKFRTLEEGTGSDRQEDFVLNSNDSRITRVGRILRRTHLDELPQLWNILRGEMSFFGPRPMGLQAAIDREHELPEYRMRVIVPPGFICPTALLGPAELLEDGYRTQLKHDLWYIENRSAILDLWTLAAALGVAKVPGYAAEVPALQLAEQS